MKIRKDFSPIACAISLAVVCACAHTQTPHDTLQAEIQNTIEDFYQAVQAQDAKTIYQMNSEWQDAYTLDEFEHYFQTHKGQFRVFAENLRNESRAQLPEISAQRADDPCAAMQLVTHADGQWRLTKVPGHDAAQTEEMRKKALLQALKTSQFHAIVENYASTHPEIPSANFRQLKRVLAFENIPLHNIQFVATEAVIDIGNGKNIRMSCETKGWRLVSCNL